MYSLRRMFRFPARLALLTVAVLLVAAPLFATPLLNVQLPTKQAYLDLASAGLDVVEQGDGYAKVVGWPEDMSAIDALGLPYSVAIEDMEAFYASRLDADLDDMGGYPTLTEINDWMNVFCLTHTDLVAGPDTIGYTLEMRPILVFKISDNPEVDEDEPEIFLNSAIHAREVITPMILMNFADSLVAGYGTVDRITNLVDNREIWFQLNVNPDGYQYNEDQHPNGGGMWRKNKRAIDGILRGVDVNRNFPFMWGYDDIGSSPDPSDETYRGASAGSEPETQAEMDFINGRSFSAVLNYHAYSNLIIVPWGYTYDHPANFPIYMAFGNYLNETLNYEVGGAEVIYTTNGDASDWQAGGADYPMYTVTFEVGTPSDGFWPPLSRQDYLIQSQVEPLFRFLEFGPNPGSLMAAPAPVAVVDAEVESPYTVTWAPTADTLGNHSVAYDIAELSGVITMDDAETEGVYGWDEDGFTRSINLAHSGSHSYYSGEGNSMTSTLGMVSTITVGDQDTLTFWARYSIEEDWDYAYVQVSPDGQEWTNLNGNLSRTTDPYGNNRGFGITGSSFSSWVRGEYPLTDFAGQTVHVRFAYITDQAVTEYGFYVDDIEPVTLYSSRAVLAEAATDTFITVEKNNLTEPTEFFYTLRSIDEEGDLSNWSEPVGTLVTSVVSVGDDPAALPHQFAVSEVYPNPFNPSTALSVTLPRAAEVTVHVHDVLGREVAQVREGHRPAGTARFTLDGTRWATGLYFVTVEAREADGTLHRAVRKAMLVK